MALNEKNEPRTWRLIKQQLFSLWVWHRRNPGAKEFHSFLIDVLDTSIYINLSMFTQICYFLLGIIDKKKRDEAIKWPLVNLRDRTMFRKALSSIVKDLIEKHSNFNIRKLNESYLIDPNYNQEKILDFILKLGNLAVYLTLNDSNLLNMTNLSDLNVNEIETAASVIYKERVSHEKLIMDNQFPIAAFEDVKIDITSRIIDLKAKNSNLIHQLSKAKKDFHKSGIIDRDGHCEITHLKEIYDGKVDKLRRINSELDVYTKESNSFLNGVKSVANPNYLKAEDLNLGDEEEKSLSTATLKACQSLSAIFDSLKGTCMDQDEKEHYHKNMLRMKEAFLNEKNFLKLFILKH